MVQRASKAAEVEKTFRRAVKRHSHAIEQIDDGWSHFAHGFDRRLVGEEISAINRVVKMLPGAVAFALKILGGVDATLCAYGVRTLDGNNREKIDAAAHFGDLDGRGESRESAADDDDVRYVCHSYELADPSATLFIS